MEAASASDSEDSQPSDEGSSIPQEEASVEDEESVQDRETALPLEQRLKLQERRGIQRKLRSNEPDKPKRKSKHAPTEVSSRRRAYFDLNASGSSISLATYKPRDPRHSSLFGHLSEDKFEENYGFVLEMRKSEIEQLRKRIQAHKMKGQKGRDKRKKLGIQQSYDVDEDIVTLKRLEEESLQLERRQIERAAHKAVKEKYGPNFKPKRKILKDSLREARLEELRKRKGDAAVQKSIGKRIKREKSKDANMKIK